MAKAAAQSEESHRESQESLTTAASAGKPESNLTLAERANLARNLYALHDWLRVHLEP